MEKRILLDKKIRRSIFAELKIFYKVKSYRELAEKLGVGYNGLKKWIDGYNYIPLKIFPDNFIPAKFIVDIKDEGWGNMKGGILGIAKLRAMYPPEIIKKWSVKGGKKNIKNLEKTRKLVDQKKIRLIKIRKRKEAIKDKLNQNISIFQKNNVFPNLNVKNLIKSEGDEKDGVTFPKVLDEDLAEEIGLHLGDGTLSERRNYFSIRGFSRDEYEYYENHILGLIRRIYGFSPKLFTRGSVCGFEKSSKSIFKFKTEVLGIPCGEKSHIIDVPKIIKDSSNERLIASFIRGFLDSDGCIWFSKNGTYPRIELASVSRYLIKSLKFYLENMGFEPSTNRSETNITLNGEPMLDLWLAKIGTNHPKHILKINIWKKFGRCPSRLSYPELKELSKAPVM